MRPVLAFLIALQLACDPGVSVTYRVSMTPAEADSISQLSVAISDAVAQRHAMEARGRDDSCSLAYYYKRLGGGGDWLDFCVRRGGNAVEFSVDEFRTWSWGPRGDALRHDLRDTLAAQFGARVSERM